MKYKEDLEKIDFCPPATAKPGSIKAYRICKTPIDSEQFLPPGKQKPKRVSKSLENNDYHYACSLMGLSLFNSEEALKQRWQSFPDCVKKKLGDQIGVIDVDPSDGLLGEVSKSNGHFELYESVGSKIHEKVSLIAGLE